MDFMGQKLSENLSTLLLWTGGILSFLLGFYLKDFEVMFKLFASCVAFTLALVVPDWPFYNRHPVQWCTVPRVETDGGRPSTPTSEGESEAQKRRR